MMTPKSENQTPPQWIFDVLSDLRKFAKANDLTDLARDVQTIEKKYLENHVTSNTSSLPGRSFRENLVETGRVVG